jgi:hypothetical protein
MVVEGHKRGRREDFPQKRKVEMDKELSEIRAEMEKLALKMQQEEKVRWRYEWPLKRKPSGCSEVVGQKATTGVKKVVEAC